MSKQHIPFRIRRSKDKQFYFVIVAKNGQVLAMSETYTRKSNCINGIMASGYEILDHWHGQQSFIDETVS